MDLKESQESQSVSGRGGNTKTPRPSHTRGRSWCLTVNNYTDEHLSQLSLLSSRARQWVIGKEVGDQGTPHLQCYFQFRNQTRFTTLKKAVPTGHWEKAKGTPQQNYNYCVKDGDFTTNMTKKWTLDEMKELVRAEYKNVVWKPWQKDVLDLVATNTKDSRAIYWIYESAGNTGKSYLTKYLLLENSAVLCSGKSTDILHGVAKTIETGILPRLIIFDVPRVSQEYVSYQALELLKNGCAFSGKYESTQLVFPSPTVICFANAPPIREKLSLDRWIIYVIKDNNLYEKP